MKYNKFQFITLFFLIFISTNLRAQNININGKVVDGETSKVMPGVNVVLKGTTKGTSTNSEGDFSLNVPSLQDTLVFSFVGYKSKEVSINGRAEISVTLRSKSLQGQEMVVVGYGQQKKESVVSAISVVDNEGLERTGVQSDFGASLTGKLPGVTTLQTTGRPGEQSIQFLIRGKSTWTGGEPLILIDGVERSIQNVDKSEVKSVSVLKDASATAIYGVEGANGVILVTTKRGDKRKTPKITFNASLSGKQISKLPNSLDAQKIINLRNDVIEYEGVANNSSWQDYVPQEIVNKYGMEKYKDVYPDVNWRDLMLKNMALSNRFGIDIRGGTNFVSYFGSVSYLHEGDIINTSPNIEGRTYNPSFSFDRINYRTNLDFNLTETTDLHVNVGGDLGFQKGPDILDREVDRKVFQSFISPNPTQIVPRYEDGLFGYNPDPEGLNYYYLANVQGVSRQKTARVITDFKLNQELGFLLKGLSIRGKVSYDITTGMNGPNINDNNNWQQKYINPDIANAQTAQDSASYITLRYNRTNAGFEYQKPPATYGSPTFNIGSLSTQLYYQGGLEYKRDIIKHSFKFLGLFNRQENKFASNWKSYRENWISRITYNYDLRYFLELNGSYSGSEKFGPGYKFDFFPSIAFGYDLSNESFFPFQFINQFKIRYSNGKVGSDQGIPRWLYSSSYDEGGAIMFGKNFNQSPYNQYSVEKIPNPNAHWATSIKQNLGLDASFLKDRITLTADRFWEHRKDIFVRGDQRAIPDLFGAKTNPAANLGETRTTGYEIALEVHQPIDEQLALWTKMNFTHSKDKILERDDPQKLASYKRQAGYQIGQNRGNYPYGYMDDWDEVYASTPGNVNNERLPGDKQVIDYNADGILNNDDAVPWGYPDRPNYNWNTTLGLNYKGWSFSAQFYGVFNISRYTPLSAFWSGSNPQNVGFSYMEKNSGKTWWPNHQNVAGPFNGSGRLGWHTYSSQTGFNTRDGSYIRLRNAQISYSASREFLKKIVNNLVSKARIYVSGYNLFMWSKDLPMDVETGSGSIVRVNYPMYKRVNFGIEISF